MITPSTAWLPSDLTTVRLTDGGDGFKRSWIMLLPEGKFEHPRFGELDLTHKTLSEMVQNFKANARGIEIALDYDHKASDGDSRAPGWLEDMQVRPAKGETPAGLWGLVRWTPLGLKDIQDQIYRYVSAEFKEDYKDDVSGEKYKNVIIGATLTNRPFMKQMPAVKLKDYSKAERDAMDESDFAGPHQSFPIKTQADVHNAARLIGHADDPAAVKAAIIRIAKRKGFSLPASWADEDSSDSGSTAASEAVDDDAVKLFNPNHDARGRFGVGSGGHASGSGRGEGHPSEHDVSGSAHTGGGSGGTGHGGGGGGGASRGSSSSHEAKGEKAAPKARASRSNTAKSKGAKTDPELAKATKMLKAQKLSYERFKSAVEEVRTAFGRANTAAKGRAAELNFNALAKAYPQHVARLRKDEGYTTSEVSDTDAVRLAIEEFTNMVTDRGRKLADDAEDLPADEEQEELEAPEEDELSTDDESESEDESEEDESDDEEEEEEEEEDEPQEASTLSEMMEHITGRKTLAAPSAAKPTAKKGRKPLPPSDDEDAADGGDDEDTELDDMEDETYDETSVSPVHIPGEMKIAKGKSAAKAAPKKMSETVALAEQVARLSEQLAERDETIRTLREAAFKSTVATRLSEMTKLIRTASEEADFALPRFFRQLYESFMFDEGVKLSENSLDRLNGLVAKALAVGTVPLTSLAGRIGSKEVVNLDDRRPRLTSKDPAKASEQRLAEAKAIALSEGVDYDALPDTGRLQFLARVRASGGNGEPVA